MHSLLVLMHVRTETLINAFKLKLIAFCVN
jgi:hypothetical protein